MAADRPEPSPAGDDRPARLSADSTGPASTPAWVPEGMDITVPSPARVYNAALGGVHNFEVDRRMWRTIEEVYPAARVAARVNRAALARAARWLAVERGIRQIVDIGMGVPVLGATHETLHDAGISARIVYVDLDPIVVDHARTMLSGDSSIVVMRGDLHDPEPIFFDPRVSGHLDPGEPVGILLGSVLPFVRDDTAAAASIHHIAGLVPPGSILFVSHTAPETAREQCRQQEAARRLYENTPTPAVLRDTTGLAALLASPWEILPPASSAPTNGCPTPTTSSSTSSAPCSSWQLD